MLYLHIYTNALNFFVCFPLLTLHRFSVTSRGQSLVCPVSPAVLAPLHLNQTWPSLVFLTHASVAKVALQHLWQLGSVPVWSLLGFLLWSTLCRSHFFSVLSYRLQLVLYWPIFSLSFSSRSVIFQGSANLFFLRLSF